MNTPVVRVERDADIAVVVIDHPPVNTVARAVRAGLLEAFAALRADATVRAIVLACDGKTFLSGGDMREFETGIEPPGYHETLAAIEAAPVPVVAALHGSVMGGGVEVAAACHARVAQAGTRFAMPEITLGIIPGGSGTQRLPRLVGFAPALDWMVSGKPIDSARALAIGLVDRVTDGDVRAAALALARELIATAQAPRRTRELPIAGSEQAAALLAERRAQFERTQPGRSAPLALLDALHAAVTQPFDAGLATERRLSDAVERAPEARALRHLFFAERELRRVPGLDPALAPRPLARVGIVGAGTMGGGIAMACANAGLAVTLLDAQPDALERGLATIRRNYERSVARGSLTAAAMAERLARIEPQLDFAALGQADVVIEAVFEDLALKQQVFARIDAAARPGAVLGTNTSTLDVDAIAGVTQRPEAVVGLHFFSPAHVMPLLEIVRGARTAPDVLATALALARRLRKTGVVAANAYGFIGNRMMDPYGREAERCVLEGATPAEVDGALESFGMAMGILAVYDMAGVDIGHLTRVARAHLLPPDPTYYRPSALLVERGWLGQKAGRGYYRYDGGQRTPDPEVIELIRAEAARLGVPQRHPGPDEIRERCLLALVNEGARLLGEGVALRASDIDLVYTAGYGFPRHRGGPMHWADSLGLAHVVERLLALAETHGALHWQVAPLLAELARRGSSFAQWQQSQQAQQAPQAQREE